MTKISKRLLSLASFVSLKDKVIDVGCDHGLLSIYLYENKLCSKIIASDVNINALSSAKENIKKRKLEIETYLSDGIKDVPLKEINTLIISGMGTGTILHILEDDKKLKNINKLIIQSNNDLDILRSNLNLKGYYMEDDVCVYDKGKWYVTCLFVKSNEVNSYDEVKYGYLKNKEYNKYLLLQEKKIYKKIPITSFKAKYSAWKKLKDIKNAIK